MDHEPDETGLQEFLRLRGRGAICIRVGILLLVIGTGTGTWGWGRRFYLRGWLNGGDIRGFWAMDGVGEEVMG